MSELPAVDTSALTEPPAVSEPPVASGAVRRELNLPFPPESSGVWALASASQSNDAAAFALHDAKNLVSALAANISWLGKVCSTGELHPETLAAIRDMSDVCSKLTNLLVGALSSCRETLTPIRIYPAETQLGELVEAALRRFRARATTKGVDLRADGDLDGAATLDAELIGRVLDNLVDNALEASPAGETVELRCACSDVEVMITVSDRGSGIPPERRRQIFDMFATRPRRSEAHFGLGLPFARAVAIEHGGYLDFKNRRDGGTTFILTLPLRPSRAHLAEPVSLELRRRAEMAMQTGDTGITVASERNVAERGLCGPAEDSSMQIQSTRFGLIEVSSEELISFPAGVIGFPSERQFVLLRTDHSSVIGWLQSTTSPGFALPVVSAHAFGSHYPDVAVEPLAEQYNIGQVDEELAVMVVLCALPNQPATVNLLAPIVVNSSTRKGAQIFLEGSRFTTREVFVLPPIEEEESEQAPPAEAAAEADQRAPSAG